MMLGEFKKFLLRGNVVDLAVGIIIGAAFVAIVNSLVADLLTPLIAMIFGKPDFSALTFEINKSTFKLRLVHQRPDILRDHRGGRLLLHRRADQRPDCEIAQGSAGGRDDEEVSGVSERDTGGGTSLCVLHVGGRAGLGRAGEGKSQHPEQPR